jgi:hypothetical protein
VAVEPGTARTTRLFCALVILAGVAGGARTVRAAEGYTPFTGEKAAWHGFDRYDFLNKETAHGVFRGMWSEAGTIENLEPAVRWVSLTA